MILRYLFIMYYVISQDETVFKNFVNCIGDNNYEDADPENTDSEADNDDNFMSNESEVETSAESDDE